MSGCGCSPLGPGPSPTPSGGAGAAAMPLDLPEGSGGLDWPLFAISSSNLQNGSAVPGVSISDALTNLMRTMQTAAAVLADANATLTVTQRDVMLAGTLTVPRSLTFTPESITAFGMPLSGVLECGTQGSALTLINGGPLAQSATVPAGSRLGVPYTTDGSNVQFGAAFRLQNEPRL